jgi:hypothetical protein
MSASIRRCIAYHRGWSGAVRCKVHHGAVWMLLRNECVNIPSHPLESSEMLMGLLSSVDDPCIANELALPVPQEWLKAWVACYCTEQQLLKSSDIRDVVNCLLVCTDPTTHE